MFLLYHYISLFLLTANTDSPENTSRFRQKYFKAEETIPFRLLHGDTDICSAVRLWVQILHPQTHIK